MYWASALFFNLPANDSKIPKQSPVDLLHWKAVRKTLQR